MILTDTGPLVALFDPGDADHRRCVVFTIDRGDFATDRIKQGRRHLA